jgi:hypothetical protein
MDTNITQEELINYFKNRNNRYKNPKGMELGLTAGNEYWTYFSLCDHNYGPLAISISTEEDDYNDFVEQFRLKSTADIDELGYSNSWMRYLNGNAEISVTPFELEATLSFRIIRRKTIIYSLDLHFYDEVYEQLTLAEDFERYISTHDNRLHLAEQNRYKMNRK